MSDTISLLELLRQFGVSEPRAVNGKYIFSADELDQRIPCTDAPDPSKHQIETEQLPVPQAPTATGMVHPYFERIEGRELVAEIEMVNRQFLEDFQWPVNRNDEAMDMRFLGPHIAYHLVRCGWRPIDSRRLIKKRQVPGAPAADAVEWVPIDSPDEYDVSKMTAEEIENAPLSVKAEAIRRFGGVEGFAQKPPEGWKQAVTVDFQGDPEFAELMERRRRELIKQEAEAQA